MLTKWRSGKHSVLHNILNKLIATLKKDEAIEISFVNKSIFILQLSSRYAKIEVQCLVWVLKHTKHKSRKNKNVSAVFAISRIRHLYVIILIGFTIYYVLVLREGIFCSCLSTTCSKSLILAIVSQLLFKFMKHGTYFECIIHDARMLLGCYDILYTRIFYKNVRVKWRSFGFSKQWCTSRKKYGRERGMSWLFSKENTPNFVHLVFQGLCYEMYLSTHTSIF